MTASRITLYRAMRPLLLLGQACGICPMIDVTNGKCSTRFSRNIAMSWIILVLAWYTWYVQKKMECNNISCEIMLVIALSSTCFSGLSIWAANIIGGFQKHSTIMLKLHRTDVLLSNPRKHYRRTWMLTVSMVVTLVIMSLLGVLCPLGYRSFMYQFDVLVCCISGFVSALNTVLYSVILYELRSRVCALNKRIFYIYKTVREPGSKLFSIPLTSKSNHNPDYDLRIRQLRYVHYRLHEVAFLVDAHFGCSQLFAVGKSFWGILLSAHEILWAATATTAASWGHVVASAMVWILSEGLKIATPCAFAASLVAESRRTGTALTVVGLSTPPSPEKDSFLTQAVCWSPAMSFTAAGFFGIDMALVFSVFGATATYLIVIAQVVLK